MPRRYRGRDNVAWRLDMHVFDETVQQLGDAMRLACPPIQTGVAGGRELSLGTLHDAGVRLTGRFIAGEGRTVHLADDLRSNATRSDEYARSFVNRVDEYIRTTGADAPEAPAFVPRRDLPSAPTRLDLAAERITNVIWSTGFRLDFGWIRLDLGPVNGYPEQTQGVSRHPGLYFMGLQLMHTRKSGLIFGVGEDAQHVTSAICRQLGLRPAAPAATVMPPTMSPPPTPSGRSSRSS
jgi:putative flavoprotein involved in K+ transport